MGSGLRMDPTVQTGFTPMDWVPRAMGLGGIRWVNVGWVAMWALSEYPG